MMMMNEYQRREWLSNLSDRQLRALCASQEAYKISARWTRQQMIEYLKGIEGIEIPREVK